MVFLAFTVLTGLAYPLVVTGVAQVAFPGRADGSLVERDGDVVGSRLIGQAFSGRALLPPAAVRCRRRLRRDVELGVEPRPDERGAPELPSQERRAAYRRENGSGGRDSRSTRSPPPAPASTRTSRSANARLQAPRVARARGLSLDEVLALVDEHTDGRSLGFLGEPGVNVLELNLALDAERG